MILSVFYVKIAYPPNLRKIQQWILVRVKIAIIKIGDLKYRESNMERYVSEDLTSGDLVSKQRWILCREDPLSSSQPFSNVGGLQRVQPKGEHAPLSAGTYSRLLGSEDFTAHRRMSAHATSCY